MSVRGVVKRYALIIEKVTRCRFPTLEAIQRFLCSHGFEVSKRTIQRDIEGIELEFGISITYDRPHRGYALIREEGETPDIFLRFLAMTGGRGTGTQT
ncbi:MAG TPA: hypothetical protein PLP29_06965 [Candidatus Ozemobacteraceae bacterium]|nr:hypothetical protein [Candidatus Ozemobacteraceae bacterium]